MRLKPVRRWLRFSLRTALVAITALCCWLGWESSIVRHRQTVLGEIRGSYAFQITTAAARQSHYAATGQVADSVATIPLMRRWLGDEAVQEIWFVRGMQGFSEAQLDRLTKAFPEAELRESLPEPCHPGCFPSGTLVETPAGRRPIESVQPGDEVTVVAPGGPLAVAIVRSVFVTTNRLWSVATEQGTLVTTETQPLCLTTDRTMQAGKLLAGATILKQEDGVIGPAKVLRVSPTGRAEKVFNLILGNSEVFIANDFLARSKPPR